MLPLPMVVIFTACPFRRSRLLLSVDHVRRGWPSSDHDLLRRHVHPAALRQDQDGGLLGMALGDAELHPRCTGDQRPFLARFDLVDRERPRVRLAVADEVIAVAVPPRRGSLAGTFLLKPRRRYTRLRLLGRHPESFTRGALITDTERCRLSTHLYRTDERGLPVWIRPLGECGRHTDRKRQHHHQANEPHLDPFVVSIDQVNAIHTTLSDRLA